MVLDEISPWLDNLAHAVAAESEDIIQEVAEYYYDDIMGAFDMEGPGWKRLSETTIKKKQRRGAPFPDRILREWNTMREAIDIRSENKMKVSITKRTRVGVFFYDPTTAGEDAVVTELSYLVGAAHEEFWRSVGLFSDTYTATSLGKPHGHVQKTKSGKKVAYKDAPFKTVNRGMMHEFGGLETREVEEGGIEEIVTGRMKQKALKGESEAAESDEEIRKKATKVIKKRTKPYYVPARSFLRMPFDRSEYDMINIFTEGIGRSIDNA